MSKEKQIEEMSKDLYDEIEFDIIEHEYSDESFWTEVCFDYHKTAENIINKGYRKQSEGKWTKHLDEWDCEYAKCSCCEAEFYDSNGDDTITIDMFYKFCPECGARMSGGKNE